MATKTKQSTPKPAAAHPTVPDATPAGGGDDKAADAAAQPAVLKDRDLLYLLGEVSWLMSRSPKHRLVFMGDLEWQVMPPVVLRQARVFRSKPQSPASEPGTPVAFVTWAFVNDAVAERLKAGNARLQPAEWRCGPHPWIVDVVAPFGGGEHAVAEVRKDVFGGEEVPVVGVRGLVPSSDVARQAAGGVEE